MLGSWGNTLLHKFLALAIVLIGGLVMISLVIITSSNGRLWLKIHLSPEFIKSNGLGLFCNIDKTCNGLVGVNCKAEVDGPYYYVEENTGEIISYCGGYCNGRNCTNCPPKGWVCK